MKSLTQSVYPSYNNNIIIWDEIASLLPNKYVTMFNTEGTYSNTVKVSTYEGQIQYNTKQFLFNPNSDFNYNCTNIVTATNSLYQYTFINTEYTSGMGITHSLHSPNGVMFLNAAKDKNLNYIDTYSDNILNKSTTFKTNMEYNTCLSYMSSTSSNISRIDYVINNNIYRLTNSLIQPVLITNTFSTTNTSFTISKTASVLDNNYKNLRFDFPSGKQLEDIFSLNIIDDFDINLINILSTNSFTTGDNGNMNNMTGITVFNPTMDASVNTVSTQALSPTRSLEISIIPISISTQLEVSFNITGLDPYTTYNFEFYYYPLTSTSTGDDSYFIFSTDNGVTHNIPMFNYNYPDENAGYVGLNQWNKFGQYLITTDALNDFRLTMTFQASPSTDTLTVQEFFDNFRMFKNEVIKTVNMIYDNKCENRLDEKLLIWKNQNGAFDSILASLSSNISDVTSSQYYISEGVSTLGGTKELNGEKTKTIKLFINWLEDYEKIMIEDLFYSNEIYVMETDGTKKQYIIMDKTYEPNINGKPLNNTYLITLSDIVKYNLNY